MMSSLTHFVRELESKSETMPRPTRKSTTTPSGAAGSLHVQLPTHVHLVTPSAIAVGDRLLGAVGAVHERTLTISLPDGVTATADFRCRRRQSRSFLLEEAPEEVAEESEEEESEQPQQPLRELWEVGQPVGCCVVEVRRGTSHADVRVSLLPKDVNAGTRASNLARGSTLWCRVRTVEDNGYTMDTGVESPPAFLPAKMGGKSSLLPVGCSLFCSVQSIAAKTGVITLERRMQTRTSKETATRESLRPGMLVEASIQDRLPAGLVCAAQNLFPATAPFTRLTQAESEAPISSTITARIVAVSQSGNLVSLSSLPHTVSLNKVQFPEAVSPGERFDGTTVLQNIPRLGVVLGLPHQRDEEPAQKAFVRTQLVGEHDAKPGDCVSCRITGLDFVNGVALASMLPDDVAHRPLQPQDLHAGQLVEGRVRGVKDDKRVFVVLSADGNNTSERGTVTAVCTELHMADAPVSRPSAKFLPGARFRCRVLSVDAATGRVFVTHKRSMIESERPPLCAFEEATHGALFQGVVVKVLPTALVVAFFGDVHGIVPKAEMSRGVVEDPAEIFRIGQPVLCRVLKCRPAEKRLTLSLLLSGNAPSETEAAAANGVGSVVRGKIKERTDGGFFVELPHGEQGFLGDQHLTDHVSHVEALVATCKPSKKAREFLILRRTAGNGDHTAIVHVSAKPSLIAAAKEGRIPATMSELEAVSPGSKPIPGHVLSVGAHGCTIGFLGNAEAFAPKSLLADVFVSQPSEHFSVGQSVLARVVLQQHYSGKDSKDEEMPEADEEKKREKKKKRTGVLVTLKHSACASKDGLLLKTLFEELDAIASKSKAKKGIDWTQIAPGTVLQASVLDVKEFGAIARIESFPALTGFIPSFQEPLSIGDSRPCFVLDVDKVKGIVDLSPRKELVTGTASHKKPEEGAVFDAVIQLVKADYVVMTLPALGNKVAFARAKDFNIQHIDVFSVFKPFQRRKVSMLFPELNGRTLVSFVDGSDSFPDEGFEASTLFASGVQTIEDIRPGMRVRGRIASIIGQQLNISLGQNIRGRVHITNIWDVDALGEGHPFDAFSVGQTISAFVLGTFDVATSTTLAITRPDVRNSSSSRFVELSLRPSLLRQSEQPPPEPLTLAKMRPGQILAGFVHEVTPSALWLVVAPGIRGRLPFFEISNNIEDLQHLSARYPLGRALRVVVVSVDPAQRLLSLSARACTNVPLDVLEIDEMLPPVREGEIVVGRVEKLQSDTLSLSIRLGPSERGRVFVTEANDVFREKPFIGLAEGQLLNCFVLSVSSDRRLIDLSLRESRIGPTKHAQNARVPLDDTESREHPDVPIENIDDVAPGAVVRGYVSLTGKKVVLVSVGRNVLGQIAKGHLSDEFLKTREIIPEKFPIGKLLECRVTAINTEEKRLVLSSRDSVVHPDTFLPFSALKPGMAVSGRVVRAEKYGVFVQLQHSPVRVLCHVSEIICSKEDATSAEKIALLSIGSIVTAKISKIEKHKVWINELDADQAKLPATSGEDLTLGAKREREEEAAPSKEAQAKRRKMEADALPVAGFEWEANPEATEEPEEMEDIEEALDTCEEESIEETGEEMAVIKEEPGEAAASPQEEEGSKEEKRKQRKLVRKAKKEEQLRREEEVSRREKELAQGKAPESESEFERALASSPGSSFLWIQFMAWHLSHSDVAAARAVAERAISSIGAKAETEKERQNVWAALLNLENTYGTRETLGEALERALTGSSNDKPLLLQYVQMLEASGKIADAGDAFLRLLRGHRTSVKCWQKYAAFSMRTDPTHDTRKLLERAMRGMPKAKQMRLIAALASAEFKHGSPERGRTMFEGALGLYPKRVDIWSIYLDMELRVGDVDVLRRLFERVTSLPVHLSSKKAKYFYKRWLAFEKQFGTDDTVAHVKQRAQQFVDEGN